MFAKSQNTEFATLVLARAENADLQACASVLSQLLEAQNAPIQQNARSGHDTVWIKTDQLELAATRSSADQITLGITSHRQVKKILDDLVHILAMRFGAVSILWDARSGALSPEMIKDAIDDAYEMRGIADRHADLACSPSAKATLRDRIEGLLTGLNTPQTDP